MDSGGLYNVAKCELHNYRENETLCAIPTLRVLPHSLIQANDKRLTPLWHCWAQWAQEDAKPWPAMKLSNK